MGGWERLSDTLNSWDSYGQCYSRAGTARLIVQVHCRYIWHWATEPLIFFSFPLLFERVVLRLIVHIWKKKKKNHLTLHWNADSQAQTEKMAFVSANKKLVARRCRAWEVGDAFVFTLMKSAFFFFFFFNLGSLRMATRYSLSITGSRDGFYHSVNGHPEQLLSVLPSAESGES